MNFTRNTLQYYNDFPCIFSSSEKNRSSEINNEYFAFFIFFPKTEAELVLKMFLIFTQN